MENEIKLLSVSEILGRNFFIPSYQRGYRWTKQQVEDLLRDIYYFATKNSKTDKEFYCLQPLVLKKLSDKEIEEYNLLSKLDNNIWYEVVDGQQRLITIRILFSYLIKEHLNRKSLYDEYSLNEFVIDYETRRDIRKFLEDVNPPSNSIDEYFISEAYSTIENWFSIFDNKRDVRESILRTLVNTMETKKHEGVVQVIWYEIKDDTNPINTFIRINMGKIPLTNAELIKALFLQKRNFKEPDVARLKQVEISNEWDKIEYSLQNEEFWAFLNNNEYTKPSRIEFIFDLIFSIAKKAAEQNSTLEEFNNEYGTDDYVTFRYFNKKLSKNDITIEEIQDAWNSIKDFFLAFDEWFHDLVWFHYIGYLTHIGEEITSIYNLYKDRKKGDFTKHLVEVIRKKTTSRKKIHCQKENSKGDFSVKFELLYDKNKKIIQNLLLLLNIQFIINQSNAIKKETGEDSIYIRFPFHLYKKENWDIEHIDSFTVNSLEDKPSRNDWLNISKEDIKDKVPESSDLISEIESFIESPKNDDDKFNNIKDRIQKLVKENNPNEELRNGIGNLTLLSAEINRSYKNALFPTKRRVIIERDKKGKFIPICTKYIFLKYFDKEGFSRNEWTEKDNLNYQKFIYETLKDFLECEKITQESKGEENE